MELRHLRYFIAVAEEENVTRAAARLHVSQPPLTRQIRDLEQELGVELFARHGRSIRLTAHGRVFLKEAAAALKRVAQAVETVREAAGMEQAELQIGYAPSPTAEVLPELLKAFRKKHPGARIKLHDEASPEMLAGLRSGRLHAALMMQPTKQAARGLKFEPLMNYPIVIAVAPDHAFAKKRFVSVREALAQPIVAYSRRTYPDYHEFLARVLGEDVKRLQFCEECDSGMSLIAAIESGKGVAVASSSIAKTAGRRLRCIPLAPPPPPAVVGIAFRPQALTPLTHKLIETAFCMAERRSDTQP